MICIEVLETGACRKLDSPIWITVNRNGPIITAHRSKALGVSDGANIWSLGAMEGYPKAKRITLAQYLEKQQAKDADRGEEES